jgi:hypothetical protein
MAVTKEILTLAVETGDALLRNGAEVYRVEDTVLHILKAYEITDCDVYVLSNGIFASANENKEDACSMIRHVPLGSTHLGRIAALNQLSREICSHECSLRMDVVSAIPGTSGIISPMTTLSCRIGIPAESTIRLKKVTMPLPKILVINLDSRCLSEAIRKICNTSPIKNATKESKAVPPNR